MNKNEFLSQLRKRLDVLTDTEIDDIIDEYADAINQKIQEGKTEEEAVQDFGDFEELVKEIGEAYKIKPNTKNTNKTNVETIFSDVVAMLSKFFTSIFDEIQSHGIGKALALIIVGLLLIFLLRIPFVILEELGVSIIEGILPTIISKPVSVIYQLLIGILFIMAIILLCSGMLKSWREDKEFEWNQIFKGNSNDEKAMYARAEDGDSQRNRASRRDREPQRDRSKPTSVWARIEILIGGIIKFFGVVVILIPLYAIIVGFSLTLGLIFYIHTLGVSLWGLIFMFIGLIGIVAIIADFFNKLIFSRLVKLKHIKTKLIIFAVCIGVGIPVTAVDIARQEVMEIVINSNAQMIKEVVSIPYDANDTYIFRNTKSVEVVEDREVGGSEMIIDVYSDDFEVLVSLSLGTNNGEYTYITLEEVVDHEFFFDNIKTVIEVLKEGKSAQIVWEPWKVRVRVNNKENFKYQIDRDWDE